MFVIFVEALALSRAANLLHATITNCTALIGMVVFNLRVLSACRGESLHIPVSWSFNKTLSHIRIIPSVLAEYIPMYNRFKMPTSLNDSYQGRETDMITEGLFLDQGIYLIFLLFILD